MTDDGSTMAAWTKLVQRFAPLLLAFTVGLAAAKEAAPVAADPLLEARMLQIAAELRCLVCQNQTIADSHAGLAEDLRRDIREQLASGASNDQVIQFMTDRYGDFIRYRPPLRASTAVLWAGPAVLLAGGLVVLVLVLRRRARLQPDRFEPDEVDDRDDDGRGEPVVRP